MYEYDVSRRRFLSSDRQFEETYLRKETVEATQTARKENIISADEYFQLVLSNRKMDRIDTEENLGLVDSDTGTRYIIHRDHLPISTKGTASALHKP